MKKKIVAGERARAIDKLDPGIWAVNVVEFALMCSVQQQSQRTNDAFPQIKGLPSSRLELRSYEVRWSRYRVILSVLIASSNWTLQRV